MLRFVVFVAVFGLACAGDDGRDAGLDGGEADAGPSSDADTVDAARDAGASALDASDSDGGSRDAGDASDGSVGADSGLDGGDGTDAGVGADTDAGLDAGTDAGVDAGTDAGLDAGTDAGVDAGTDAGVDAGSPGVVGLDTPCGRGPGSTLFRFGFHSGSTSPRIDVWDPTCSYAPFSACSVAYFGSGTSSVMSGSAVLVTTSSATVRVRYSVAGLSFSRATLYVQARSYSTSSSTNVAAWSPIYGGKTFGPVDNDFTYDWYAVDWSDSLSPSDSPSLTAIELNASGGSGQLALRNVELCLEP